MPRFEAFIAERYLRTRRKGAFVKVMVGFARWGIALGVFALVVTLALMNGFREEIQHNLFSATAHFTLQHISLEIPDTEETLKKIRSLAGVVAASPTRMEKALLRGSGHFDHPEAVAAKAVDPASAGQTSSIFESLKPAPIAALKEGELVVGKELADRLGLRVGDEVALSLLRLDLGLAGLQPKVVALRVAGIFHSHISEYDRNWVFMHLADSSRIARSEEAEMIEVRSAGVDAIDGVKRTVLGALNGEGRGGFLATDLRDTNRPLFAALKLEKWLFAGIIALIVMVAAFNIVASLVLLVTEKRRDLGVLLALGATPKQVQRLFELQGVRIGAVGTLWGLGLSVPFCLLADHFRLIRLPAAVYDFITYLPFRLHLGDLALVVVFPLLVAWWASRYPAKRAAHVDPVEALRAE